MQKFKIAVSQKRNTAGCQNVEMTWEEFLKRIKTPVKTYETYEQYKNFNKEQKNDVKDVGGFIAGESIDGKKTVRSILNRCMVTLDLDHIDPNKVNAMFCLLDGLGCKFVVYSTRNYTPAEPRLRVIIPTNRTMTPEEYEPVARKIASIIGIEFMDSTTFQFSRVMYWPSCSCDTELALFKTDSGINKEFANVDTYLSKYENWHNIEEWARVPNESEIMMKNYSGKNLGNPAEKDGTVGLFCSIYNIHSAIEKFLSDVYEPRKYAKLLHTNGKYCSK